MLASEYRTLAAGIINNMGTLASVGLLFVDAAFE